METFLAPSFQFDAPIEILNTQPFVVTVSSAGHQLGAHGRALVSPNDPVVAGAIKIGWLLQMSEPHVVAGVESAIPRRRKR